MVSVHEDDKLVVSGISFKENLGLMPLSKLSSNKFFNLQMHSLIVLPLVFQVLWKKPRRAQKTHLCSWPG